MVVVVVIAIIFAVLCAFCILPRKDRNRGKRTERQTNKQTNRQTDRQKGIKTEADRQTSSF